MTDVDSEMEAMADQSAARTVKSAAPNQKDVFFGSQLTPGVHMGTSMGLKLWGLKSRQLHLWLLNLASFLAPQSRFLLASCLNRLPVQEVLRRTFSSSIPQRYCPPGTPQDMITVSIVLLCD